MKHAKRIIACDVPTSPDLKIEATVCFHQKKECAKGKVTMVDIGLPSELEHLYYPSNCCPPCPPLTAATRESSFYRHSKNSECFFHKGDNGRVLVVGGSELYVGAPYLAGKAALKVCDIVTVAAPEKVAWAINLMNPDLITLKLPGCKICKDHISTIKSVKHDVMLVGNGMGESEAITPLLRLTEKKVIDADSFRHADLRRVRNAILTPHRGEFERLLKNSGIRSMLVARIKAFEKKLLLLQDSRKEYNLLFQEIKMLQPKLYNNVLLLKGPLDLVISQTDWKFNVTGCPRMAVAGTGDVLAGLCAGLAATKPLFEAACMAAFINGKTGEEAAIKNNQFYASDLIEYLH